MEDMLGAGSFIPMTVTRLTIGRPRAGPGAYPVGPPPGATRAGWGPRTAIPLAHWGKSLADDLARTRYCKLLSGLAATNS